MQAEHHEVQSWWLGSSGPVGAENSSDVPPVSSSVFLGSVPQVGTHTGIWKDKDPVGLVYPGPGMR